VASDEEMRRVGERESGRRGEWEKREER